MIQISQRRTSFCLWNLRCNIFWLGVIFLFFGNTTTRKGTFFVTFILNWRNVTLYNTIPAHAWRVLRRFILLCKKPSWKNQKKFKFFYQELGHTSSRPYNKRRNIKRTQWQSTSKLRLNDILRHKKQSVAEY